VIVALVAALLGAPEGMVRDILGGAGSPTTTEQAPTGPVDPAEQKQMEFVKVILGYTEDAWTGIFRAQGKTYAPPKLKVFRDRVNSACGLASSAVGPFYCPPDRRVFLDLAFFSELDRRFGAPGDFAQAYVIAHEVGHHVQTLTGVSEQVHERRAQTSKTEGNRLSVMQELQADCYAGVWAHHAHKANRQLMEPGDIEEGLRAASAIGDDTLQRQSRGSVVPESFTHGSSEQRVRWFKQGMSTGTPASCDTFAARTL
jgi:uncharacterized protein